jgi:ABC-type transporter Mla subunit MlaD
MKENQNRRVLAGLVLLVVLSGLTLFVFFLDDVLRAVERRYTLYAVFPSAPRLRIGAQVWIGGQEVGLVRAIGFKRTANDTIAEVAVRLEIPTKYQHLVRQDSRIRFASERLIGEPVIDISPGSQTVPQLQSGDTLFGAPRAGMMEALNSLVSLRQSIDSLLQATRQVAPLAARTTRQFARLNANLARVQEEFAELRAAFAHMGTDGFLDDPTLGQAFERVTRTASQLGPAFEAAAARYSDPALRQSFTRLKDHASALSARLDELQRTFANGTLMRAGADDALKSALAAAQSQLDSLVTETRRNPLRFLVGDPQRGLSDPLKRTR